MGGFQKWQGGYEGYGNDAQNTKGSRNISY
ncbi:hypothetical protein PhaeoP14_01086 [Phaeobacter piscinae]|nr:hypothetical protein PhaeoP14_01086 [Phaeobacter piscinae]